MTTETTIDFPPLPESDRDLTRMVHPHVAFSAQQMRDYVAADRARSQAGQEPVASPDTGPWQVDDWPGGKMVLQSAQFKHDVALIVDGDFAEPSDKRAYADKLCKWMNQAAPQPVQGLEAPVLQMKQMEYEDGRIGWYINAPGFYCDIDPEPDGKYSVFCRDKQGREGFFDPAAPQPAQADTDADIAARNTCNLQLLSVIDSQQAEIEALKTKLEVDPAHSYDGIDCRDETIKMQDEAIAALRKDAARYRWLRDAPHTNREPHISQYPAQEFDNPQRLQFLKVGMDTAIDAAMAQAVKP